jgi:hypothetical protein
MKYKWALNEYDDTNNTYYFNRDFDGMAEAVRDQDFKEQNLLLCYSLKKSTQIINGEVAYVICFPMEAS